MYEKYPLKPLSTYSRERAKAVKRHGRISLYGKMQKYTQDINTKALSHVESIILMTNSGSKGK